MLTEIIRRTIARNQQSCEQEYRDWTSQLYYDVSFKTIHINAGRRSGHTSAIIELCRHSDVVIQPNYELSRTFERNCVVKPTIVSASALINEYDKRRGVPCREYDYVWVDEPAMCERVSCGNLQFMKSVYELFPAKLYILLGA